jgi:phospholipase/carboxylesterase
VTLNGANFLAGVIQLHPGLVRRAVLLRSVQPFEEPKAEALSATHVLMLNGRNDPFIRYTSTLKKDLTARGAEVLSQMLPAGHELSVADMAEATRQIRQQFSDTANEQLPSLSAEYCGW